LLRSGRHTLFEIIVVIRCVSGGQLKVWTARRSSAANDVIYELLFSIAHKGNKKAGRESVLVVKEAKNGEKELRCYKLSNVVVKQRLI